MIREETKAEALPLSVTVFSKQFQALWGVLMLFTRQPKGQHTPPLKRLIFLLLAALNASKSQLILTGEPARWTFYNLR
jgi:hypothetical protein